MTIRSDEIAMGNPNFVHDYSYRIFSDAITISFNW